MITLIILLAIMGSLGLAFAIGGVVLSVVFWICIKLPIAIVLGSIGLALCCTIILIPVGAALISAAADVLFSFA